MNAEPSSPLPGRTADSEAPSERDLFFLDLAFAEAYRVKGKTLPNPAVGAVLVKDGEVVGCGGTQRPGEAHAEIMALREAGEKARGSTLYVTLEPCCHTGRTGPCTRALIEAGVREVVATLPDAFPAVNGRGFEELRRAGLAVRTGLRREEAEDLYEGFFHRSRTGYPLIHLKVAESLDGKVNAAPGIETPITNEASRAFTHALRRKVDAVLVGAGTLRSDDPELTVRLPERGGRDGEAGRPEVLGGPAASGPQPDALILTEKGPLPPQSRLFAPGRAGRTVVLGPAPGLPDPVIRVANPEQGPWTAAAVLEVLQERGYHAVLVEGGPRTLALFLDAGRWDRLHLLKAPKLFPAGESWHAHLSRGWDKGLVFHKFADLSGDLRIEVRREPCSPA